MKQLVQEAVVEADRLEVVSMIFDKISAYAHQEARKAVLRLIDAQKAYGDSHRLTEEAMFEACDYHAASQRISLQYGDRLEELELAVFTLNMLRDLSRV